MFGIVKVDLRLKAVSPVFELACFLIKSQLTYNSVTGRTDRIFLIRLRSLQLVFLTFLLLVNRLRRLSDATFLVFIFLPSLSFVTSKPKFFFDLGRVEAALADSPHDEFPVNFERLLKRIDRDFLGVL